MKQLITSSYRSISGICLGLTLAGLSHAEEAKEIKDAWWNADWTERSKITFDTSDSGAGLADPAGTPTVLVRLSGNFQAGFSAAKPDGSDLRFVAADGKTLLPHQIERYDVDLFEALVWVKLPDAKPATKDFFHVYSGNASNELGAAGKPTDTYDENFSLVYHFNEISAAPVDSTVNGNNAETLAVTSQVGMIGNGLLLSGAAPINIPAKPSLQWQQGQTLTLSAWIKPTALQKDSVIFSRSEGNSSFRLLLDQGMPVIDLAGTRSANGAPVAAATWTHLAVVADGKTIQLFVNGTPYGNVSGALPALNGPLVIGGPATAPAMGFLGEMDEFTLSKTARSTGWVKLTSVNQGGSDRSIALGEAESGEVKAESGGMMEHLSLFGDIANNMMFDGWIAIGVCAIMIIVGWTVAVKKFLYLNSIEKGTKLFLKQWKSLSTDLTALDTEDKSSVASLGGTVDGSQQALLQKSPLFHIYQIGADEIRHRLDKDNNRVQGLSGRSIQAIRASLDAGLVHETHRLSDGLVYLTMSIAGGPYVGLLGTVVGVMITFAIIAKSGEVNVNSIAPGIASALLATVVGLVVAIPALFIYSYLNGRIKNSLGLMQVFIDEFVAKMAEFYRPAQEADQTGSKH